MEPSPRGTPTLDSQVSLVHIPTKAKYFILAKASTRRHVEIIGIDSGTGALRFTQTYGRDMFPTEAQALEYLKHEGPFEVVGSGKYVLGYVVIGHTGLLLLVEKVRVSATLPGNHQVKTVVSSKWHRVPLQSPQLLAMSQGQTPIDPESIMSPVQREEYTRGVDKITTFPIDGAHYFCETIDLTRPFPSFRSPSQPSWEFVWNKWLMTAFRSVGLDFLCPALMQGLCEERQLNDFDGAPYSIALISRRARLHVGPRYKARGLNDYAEPANEIEVEQVIWRKPAQDNQPVSWSRYTWRRGSVPLWWGVHMKNNGLGEAEIKIKENRTFKGSRRYVRRLQKRYCPLPILDPEDSPNSAGSPPDAQPAAASSSAATPRSAAASSCGSVTSSMAIAVAQDPSLLVPLVFVSLLRKGTPDRDRSEAKLAAAFDFICNTIRKEHRIPLTYIALDWHELDKQLGSHALVSAFWSTIKDQLPQHKFALGTLTKVGQDHYDLAKAGLEPPLNDQSGLPTERCTSYAGIGWRARWFRQQRGMARYNCADSLDRTNVGSFFGAVQVLVEQCRELDIAIAVGPRGMGSIVSAIKRHNTGAPGSTPAGAAGGSAALSQRHSTSAPRSLATTSQRGNPSTGLSQGLDKINRLFNGHSQGSSSPQLARPSSPAFNAPGALEEIAKSLPHGWDVKIDNASERLFYVDHNTRTTHWQHPSLSQEAVEELSRHAANLHLQQMERNAAWNLPSPQGSATPGPRGQVARTTLDSSDLAAATDKLRLAEEEREQCEPLSPWGMLTTSAKQFQRRINPVALSAMAELFLVNGDMSAWLYTGSQAMHSERILLFEPENSKLRKAGVGAYGNIMVGIKRRYNNVMMDTERQHQIELFLGMKHSVYFPMTKLYYKEEGPVPLDNPETDDESDPVGHIDWKPADRSGLSSSGAATGPEGSATLPSGHNRHRNKSYSSVDLLWDKVSAAGAKGKSHLINMGIGALIPGALDRGGSPGSGAAVSAGGMPPQGVVMDESAQHMHKTVSDPTMMMHHMILEQGDMASEVSSQASAAHGVLGDAADGTMSHSQSVEQLQGYTSHSPSPVPFRSTGAANRLSTSGANSGELHPLSGVSGGEQPRAASAFSGRAQHLLPDGEQMRHSASAGGLAGMGVGTDGAGASGEQRTSNSRLMPAALREGLKKFNL